MVKSTREERKVNVIRVLNEARAMELSAIHQYMNQHYNLDSLDYGEFAAKIKLIAIDEMRHAEMLAERIKELDGEPTTEIAKKIVTKQEVKAIFEFDANSEDYAIEKYNEFNKVCLENGDVVSAKLFEVIIEEEQAHYNHFDNTDKHIKALGDAYLARVAGTSSDIGPSKGFVNA